MRRGGAVVVLVVLAGLAIYRWSRPQRSQSPAAEPTAPVPVRRGEAQPRPALDVPAVFIEEGARPQRIAGRVVRDGAPVGGATVRLSLEIQPPFARAAVRSSGADGRFDFGEVTATRLVVSAWAKGTTPAVRGIRLRSAKDREEAASLELALGGCKMTCFGTVQDAQGTPTPRARVGYAAAVVEAEEDGAYELCLVGPTSPAIFGADGYGTIIHLVQQGRLDVVLLPEATIAGSVLAPDGGRPRRARE